MSTNQKPYILIYEAAYTRLHTQLDGLVTPLVMDASGSVYLDGQLLTREQIQPEIAWANRDIYEHGPVRQFMVACLKSQQLRWLQSSAAGFEHPVFAKLAGNGVKLCNSNASAVPIAEFVMAQVISAFHPTQARLQAQEDSRWQIFDFRDLYASTWLIYGLGNIGTEVAQRARAFGAYVIGCRRTPVGDEPVDEMITTQALLGTVGRADVVVLTAALNPQNRHVANAAFFSALSGDCVFVNVGRGGLVDEVALAKGLEHGRPQLAVLDVFEEEPLPQKSPFWQHPQVRITAHCAGASAGTGLRGDALFLDNLDRYLNQQPLRMQVADVETAV